MVNRDKRVYVYFNLHKKCWSVRQSGKIVDHTNQVLLRDCRYLVGQAGRKKVLKEIIALLGFQETFLRYFKKKIRLA